MAIKIKHTVEAPPNKDAAQIAKDIDYVPWKIQLDGTPAELKGISKVEYYLPTKYPQPKVTRKDPADNFMYNAYANESFPIDIKIYFRQDENQPKEKRYKLTIDNSNDIGEPI